MSDIFSNSETNVMDDLINDLRNGLEENRATTNSTPEVQRKAYFSTKFQDVKHLKPFLIRGLMLFLAILLIGQIFYVTITLPKLNSGGPITISAAVEQLGADLEPTLAPPPSIR